MKLPEMEATATENMVWGLVSRIERCGHFLTPRQVDEIHRILTDATPDNRTEGTQKDLSAFINDRIERDGREG
jgi:hypothetical protein